MATLEDEIRDLKEKNNELVQKVQYWKVAAANKENEKLELMKEINELRLKLSRIRSGGAAQLRKLDTALQAASEEALTHLVQASSAVARTMELAKTYMQDRQDLDNASPRWSAIGGTPNSEKVHRVPPLLIGGQSIQPVVSLSRTLLNASTGSHSRSMVSRSPNQNRSVTERAVPMHMLQDVYIPLTRIDASELPGNNMETETEPNELNTSTEDLGLEDSGDRSVEDSQNMSEGEDFESSRRLEAVAEDIEPESIDETPPRIDNPLEGPSWLLDRPTNARSRPRSLKSKSTLEPDSTTLDENSALTPTRGLEQINEDETSVLAPAFTPTVRRRKRTTTPPRVSCREVSLSPVVASRATFSPRPAISRRNSNSGRVLKVLVAKMRLDSDSDPDDAAPAKRPARAVATPQTLSRELSPTKRLMRFDAPSPNGATDARVIVLEQTQTQSGGSGEPMKVTAHRRDSRISSHDSRKSKPRHCGDGHNHSKDKMTSGDDHSHTRDGQNRLAEKRDHEDRESSDSRTDEVKVERIAISTMDSDEDSVDRINVSNRRGNIRGTKERKMGRDDRGGIMGSDMMGSMRDEISRIGSMDHSRMDGRDSDSSTELAREGRTRRPRKQVVYKEKPLNRKMRR